MSQVRLVKLKFKPGGKQAWLDWCKQLKKRSEEVLETLQKEGTFSESCFLSRDGESLYYFMEAKDLEQARQAAQTKSYAIDREHRDARKASLEFVEELIPLFQFENR